MIRFPLMIGTAVHLIVLFGCAGLRDKERDYDATVGWLHGGCLAITNPDLKPGQTLAIVTLDKPQKRLWGRLEGKLVDGEHCHVLGSDRRQVNERAGYSFYTVSYTSESSLAIGLLPSAQQELLPRANAGELRRFSYCSSNEGVHFSLWQNQPYASERLWTGYYYLGYESEADCP